jgi:RNA polymerase sigma-70 factor (ECF subfamily)
MMSDTCFEALMSEHHAEIFRYLLRVTGRRSDADDLSQETFLRAFRAYATLTPDANTRAWLFTIATNLFRNHYRDQKRRRLAYAEVTATARDRQDEHPGHVQAGRETSGMIEAVVVRLPLKQRLAFVQRKVHGLEYEAIGQSLRCSAESARAHVFQALKKIRQGLDVAQKEPSR